MNGVAFYKLFVDRLQHERLGMAASSLSFTTTLAIVPLLAVVLAVLSVFPVFGHIATLTQQWLISNWVPDRIAQQVLRYLSQFSTKASRLGGAGLLMLTITALALMFTIDRTLNNIWRAKSLRPFGQRVLIYWAALSLGPLALGLSVSLGSYALSASKGWVVELPVGIHFLLSLIVLLGSAGFISALFHYIPNVHVRWSDAWAGGLLVTFVLEIAKWILGQYLKTMSNYSAIYGTFAVLPIFFIWLYVTWMIVLLGGVMVASLPALRLPASYVLHVNTPKTRLVLARRLIAYLANQIADLDELSVQLNASTLAIESLLEPLIKLGWIGQLANEREQYIALPQLPQDWEHQLELGERYTDVFSD